MLWPTIPKPNHWKSELQNSVFQCVWYSNQSLIPMFIIQAPTVYFLLCFFHHLHCHRLCQTMNIENNKVVFWLYFQLAFFNIYAARLWHDLHDSRVFIDYLRDKITRKLLKVKVKIIGDYRSNFFPLRI